MKRIKKWLLPILTCLVVAGAAVLPARISEARDARQFGQIHTETLEADGLPVYEPPSLMDRLELYARWCAPSETIPSVRTPVVMYDEDPEQSKRLVRQALDHLAQAEVIPSHLSSSDPAVTSMDRILLWDPAVSIGRQEPVEFWQVAADLGDGSFWMRLDGESGLPLELSLYDPNMARWLAYKDPDTLPDLAGHYFGLLGVEAVEVDPPWDKDDAPWDLQFSIQGADLVYWVSFNATMLNINPEYGGAGAYGSYDG